MTKGFAALGKLFVKAGRDITKKGIGRRKKIIIIKRRIIEIRDKRRQRPRTVFDEKSFFFKDKESK